MPTPAEQLTVGSSDVEVRQAISGCISMMMKENPDMAQDQAVAICHSMARKAMGHGDSKVAPGKPKGT